VLNLLRDLDERVYPVGRLDYDSEGLLLLTNDGDLTMALTHPAHKVRKTYRVRVKGMPSSGSLNKMSAGLNLEDGPTAPAEVFYIDSLNGNALLEISIHEGRNRQVKRMCEHIGHQVLRLKRISIGELKLGDLKPGKYRHLTRQEIARLKKS
jgi:pseudouridine synthase